MSYIMYMTFKSHCWNNVMPMCAPQAGNGIDAQNPNYACPHKYFLYVA